MRIFAIAQICIGCALLLAAVFVAFMAYEMWHAVPACLAVLCAVIGCHSLVSGDRELQALLDQEEESIAEHQ